MGLGSEDSLLAEGAVFGRRLRADQAVLGNLLRPENAVLGVCRAKLRLKIRNDAGKIKDADLLAPRDGHACTTPR